MFVIGGLLGALAFTFSYGPLGHTFLFEPIAGDAATIANTGIEGYSALVGALPAFATALALVIVLAVIAILLPETRLDWRRR